jgi:hypothetical protein
MPNAVVMTGYGPPEVLKWTAVPLAERRILAVNATARVRSVRSVS